MKHSIDFLTKVFASHIPGYVEYQGSDGRPDKIFYDSLKDDYSFRFKLTGLRNDPRRSYTLFGDIVDEVGEVVESGVEIDIKDGRLLLIPLSKITDEDAIEVAKIITGNNICQIVEKRKGSILFYVDSSSSLDEGLQIELKFTDYVGRIAQYAQYQSTCLFFYQRVVDFLRSRGYDCGYGEIPSLIEAGIAIDKTTL